MLPDFSLLRAERAHSEIERLKIQRNEEERVRKRAALWGVFFSLRGRLPRDQWRWAMVVAGSIFVCVASLLTDNNEAGAWSAEWAGPSWSVLLWCAAALCVVTLLCAKRLLSCGRPVWLALTVAGPGLLLILASAAGPHRLQPTFVVMAAYFAVFALPALIACTMHDAEE